MSTDLAVATSAPAEPAVAEMARCLQQGETGSPPPPIAGGRTIDLFATSAGEGWIQPCPGSDDRRDGTRYAEARKGA